MTADEIDREMKRLREQGRELNGPPTARQDLLARMLDPAAWSEHAQEHIDWGARYNRLYPSICFGGQFAYRRGIALARARDMLDALMRLDEGLPQVERLDLRVLVDGIQKDSPYDRDGRTPRAKALLNLRMLSAIDGGPMPRVDDEGDAFTLAWTLRTGEARLRVGADHHATGWLVPARADFQPWTRSVHSRDIAARIGDLLRTRPDSDTRRDPMNEHPTIPDDVAIAADGSPARLSAHHLGAALEGATTVYDVKYDNDTEALFITRAGQYVRRTGEGGDRYYVLDRNDARDLAEGRIEDAELDMLIP